MYNNENGEYGVVSLSVFLHSWMEEIINSERVSTYRSADRVSYIKVLAQTQKPTMPSTKDPVDEVI